MTVDPSTGGAVTAPPIYDQAAAARRNDDGPPAADFPSAVEGDAPPNYASAAHGQEDGPAVLATQVEATPVIVDGCVTQARCEAHLRILGAFHALQAPDDEVADLMFLCRGEIRYETWMRALAQAIHDNPNFIAEPPLPPVDVAMFWFAHMLSLIRYNDDMNRLFGAAILDVAFPLERMAHFLNNGTDCSDSQE
ncbi:hypothetical protein GGF32_009557 [Allomyces javanicus]|nr:hypothetical protein GGF32_009557 [Allomyces javanicus]